MFTFPDLSVVWPIAVITAPAHTVTSGHDTQISLQHNAVESVCMVMFKMPSP